MGWDAFSACESRCLCLVMGSKVSTINIEGLEQAGGRLVAMASHREVPKVVRHRARLLRLPHDQIASILALGDAVHA